jgi:PAS domain-containing protein
MLAGYELRRQRVAAELWAHPRDDSAFTVVAYTCGSQMSSPSDSSEQPARRPPALSDGNGRSTERRRRPPPNSPDEYLRALPASVLLDRMPVPMIAAGLDGVVVYNNPAFATMLGHGPDVILAGFSLPALLDGHSTTPPSDCVATLRTANNVLVDWLHTEGFPVRSVVSESLYIRATDQLLLFGVTDLTELLWMYPPE